MGSTLAEGRQVDVLGSLDSFVFEGFRFDLAAGGLFRSDGSGVAEPVALGSRALALLALFVERPGQLVSKDDIFAVAWSGTVVGENNLPVQISALRRVLDQGRAGGSCIQTIPGRGYRFILAVTRIEADNILVDGGHIATQLEASAARRGGVVADPNKLSIVVLPFANLSNDPEQQYFADGITEELTTDLSRLANMFVISCNTAFTYQGKRVDTKQIGRELGVRYVLQGSIRRSGARVRVSAQLIDAITDVHLWGERFDSDDGDLFSIQDAVTSRIAVALNLELIRVQGTRPVRSADALDYLFRGRAVGLRPRSRDTIAEQITMYERALALDPQSAEGRSRLAGALVERVLNGIGDAAAGDLCRTEALVSEALAASPGNAYAHFVKGRVLRAQGRCHDAITEFETSLALSRNMVDALWGLAWCKLYAGSLDEVIPLMEKAILLSPRDPIVGSRYHLIGVVHLLQSRFDHAILWLEKARRILPGYPYHHSYLAAAYALDGDITRAGPALEEARRLSRDDRFASLVNLSRAGYFGLPGAQALFEATYFVGLRKAGMPEE